jgi:FtsH-binding integral membrane protein
MWPGPEERRSRVLIRNVMNIFGAALLSLGFAALVGRLSEDDVRFARESWGMARFGVGLAILTALIVWLLQRNSKGR